MEKGDLDDAIASYQQVISIDPNDTEARQNLADIHTLKEKEGGLSS